MNNDRYNENEQRNNETRGDKRNVFNKRIGKFVLALVLGTAIFLAGYKTAECTNDDVAKALNQPQADNEITNVTNKDDTETLLERLSNPLQFSESVGEYSIKSGEGLFSVAGQVEGVGNVDIRDVVDYIKNMQENEGTIPESGILQPGMIIRYPLTVEKK